jgi:hydrophobic/amphiphilic exporter-1 (mainly G- bacteria), HAE1 family
VGGLLISQFLALYTTPVVYLYLDRLAHVFDRRQRRNLVGAALGPPADIANIHAAFMDKRA